MSTRTTTGRRSAGALALVLAATAVLPATASAASGAALAAPVAAASPAAAVRSEPLLVVGMRGAHVERWQDALNAWLSAQSRTRLVADGIFGPRTLAATRGFQQAAGLRVDGVVGPRTRAALTRALQPRPAAPFDGTVGISERAPVRGPVAVTDVRTGSHDGFDRVVFDLAGTGRAGWQVRYVDSPVRQQGSGSVVPLAGDGQLEVVLTGISMPADVGGLHYEGPDRPALGRTGVVEDLFVGNLYEGRFATWIGTRSPEQFRVFALDDPQRVVVDVAHPR